MSGTKSKEASISHGLMRRTNGSIMRGMSWTNTRSTRSMSTIMTYPTREGVIKPSDEKWLLTRNTSVHAMRRAMNN
jgi:hypothetical protein